MPSDGSRGPGIPEAEATNRPDRQPIRELTSASCRFLLVSQPLRQVLLNFRPVPSQQPLHVEHARPLLLPVPGRNCASRSRLIVTHCAWVVRSIGFLVQARYSSQPKRCFRSRNPSSCRNRGANNSTICSPVNSTAEVTSVNRFLDPSTLATTALTATSCPDTRQRPTTSLGLAQK